MRELIKENVEGESGRRRRGEKEGDRYGWGREGGRMRDRRYREGGRERERERKKRRRNQHER